MTVVVPGWTSFCLCKKLKKMQLGVGRNGSGRHPLGRRQDLGLNGNAVGRIRRFTALGLPLVHLTDVGRRERRAKGRSFSDEAGKLSGKL